MKMPENPTLPTMPTLTKFQEISRYKSSWFLKLFSKKYQDLVETNNILLEHNKSVTEQINLLIDNNTTLVEHNKKLTLHIDQLSQQNRLLHNALMFRPIHR